MPTSKQILNKLRRICLSYPDAEESETWGKPHFRVKNKIFCGFGEEEDGTPVIGFKLSMAHQKKVIARSGFWKAPYVGKHGWVSMDASKIKDWKKVEAFVDESFRLIAPKRTLAKLED
ncbi:MAG: MmcQ/YjbR family DNA-binding protein [Candidatus Eisenbacteria bacterium]|uniref:MmcQ/YjbR family DNA-binding protein n=1 Tax=Eiseniibacteriota bacterium TaxID=2212470 RepID=A0A7Y2EA02_UNCEI|nr:MmcQ/YjbR family DNA-binding protein [Candidatus Eisenbacteria bacterium]